MALPAWFKARASIRFDHMRNSITLTTTANSLAGYAISRELGVVRGIIVRSRSIVGNIGAGFQSLFGGNITLYTELCERARSDAFQLMLDHAAERGANAIVAVRFDATELSPGITEVLCYGTAVVVETSPH
jgi:uncharacterized protein YbjQ (UPF0145 family)